MGFNPSSTSCVTSGNIPSFSESLMPHLQDGGMKASLPRCLWRKGPGTGRQAFSKQEW